MSETDLFEYSPATGLRLKHPSGGGVRLREVEPAGATHRSGGGRVVREDGEHDSRSVQEFVREVTDRTGPRADNAQTETDHPTPATIFAKSICQ